MGVDYFILYEFQTGTRRKRKLYKKIFNMDMGKSWDELYLGQSLTFLSDIF